MDFDTSPTAGLEEEAPAEPYAPSPIGARFVGDVTTELGGEAAWLEKQAAKDIHPEGYAPALLPTPEANIDQKTLQARFPGVKGIDQDMPLSVAQEVAAQAKRVAAQQDVLANYPSGAGNTLLGVGTDMMAGFLDPVQDAAFMVPVVGEARYAAWLARAGESAGMAGRLGVTAGVGALRGAAGGAILGTVEKVSGLDPDMTLGDIASQSLQTAWMGSVAHTGIDIYHAARGMPSDILGTNLVEERIHPDAATHDAAVRVAAAQMANGDPVEVRPLFGSAAKYKTALMQGARDVAADIPAQGAAPGQMVPEAKTALDNAVARAGGAPSQEEIRGDADAQKAHATPTDAVVDGEMAEAERTIAKMRANGDLDPEEEALLQHADEEAGVSHATKAPDEQEKNVQPVSGEKATEAAILRGPPRAGAEGIPGAGEGEGGPAGGAGEEPRTGRKGPSAREQGLHHVGENSEGRPLFEDQKKVRSYFGENGARITEPVQMRIKRGGIEYGTDRNAHPDFKTREEAAAKVEPPVGEAAPEAARAESVREDLVAGKPVESPAGERVHVEPNPEGDGYVVTRTEPRAGEQAVEAPKEGEAPWTREEAINHASTLAGAPIEAAPARAEIAGQEPANEDAREPGGISGEGGGTPGTEPPEGYRPDEAERDLRQTGGQPEPGDRGLDQHPGAEAREPGQPVAAGEGEAGLHEPHDRGERRDEGISAPGRGEREADRPERRVRGSNFRLDRRDVENNYELAPKHRATSNIFAIQTLGEVPESALPTNDQQTVMARYIGWGGLPQVFDEENSKFASTRALLKELLTPEQYDAARASTINAHYTSPEVVEAMWSALKSLGFDGDGTILEPGMGIGNFLGLRPEGVEPKFTGVELDDITGKLARALYPQARIHIDGFEKVKLPENSFDAVIGNVPFADYKPYDQVHNPGRSLSLHNYFIAKSIALMKPGGIMGVVTTHYTLDAVSSAAREAFQKAGGELIGAIRLPDTAFGKSASTEVTTDILFFRKRANDVAANTTAAWLNSPQQPVGDGKANYNAYFAEHPEDVLGEHALTGTMYKKDSYTVSGSATGLGERIKARAEAIAQRTQDRFSAEPSDMQFMHSQEEAGPEGKEGAYFERDGRIMQNTAAGAVDANVPKNSVAMVGSMIRMRDLARDVLSSQKEVWDGKGTPPWADAQARLNKEYDAFSEKYGPINKVQASERTLPSGEVRLYRRYPNLNKFREDPDAFLVASLERYDEETGKASKAAIMSERVVEPTKEITHVDTPDEALIASMNQKGGVDMPYMAKLLGKPEGEVAKALNGRMFRDPDSGDYHLAETYLSGDVRAKLAAARAAALKDRDLDANVRALEAVQPKDLEAHQIDARLGAPWVPASDIQDFAKELLGSDATVKHLARDASWNFDLHDKRSVANNEEWGVQGATAERMIHDALNQIPTQVKYYDPDGNLKVDLAKTIVAQEKQNQIKDRFSQWLWEDEERTGRLARFYNDNYNNLRTPESNGDHLTLPGSSTAVSLRATQKNAVWRYLVTGNTLLDHVVGAGKTYTSIAAGMEAKRLGLLKKPAFVVPNHMLEQFSREYMQMYPGARILVANKDEMKKNERRAFIGKAATGNWDAVILTHSGFERVPLSAERQTKFIRDEIASYADAIKESKGDRVTIKMLEAGKKRREAKLAELMDAKEKDAGLTFEDSGIDGLFVDEAHLFKNLEFATKIRGMASASSQRAFDLYTKTRYINDLTPGRGLMFMTGTPISNSMAEMYTMQRYLHPDALAQRNLSHFDGWAAQFGDTVVKPEISPDGLTARLKARFARFRNIPELVSMYRQFADHVTSEDLVKGGLVLPKLEGGKQRTVVAPGSPELLDYVHELAARAEKVRSGQVDKTVDNMLKISNDGRQAALDMRLVNPDLPPDPSRKAMIAADAIAEIHKRTSNKRGTQVVFLDRSTPKAGGGFNSYDDIRQGLIDRGVPAKEITYVHSADTDEKKARLFADVRAGRVRVLMGSTDKMGVGTNVQDRLTDLHNIDTPWRPSDLEQRVGRIVRQGNPNAEVGVHNYVTEGSFDAYMWQTLERKARFINQVKNGDPNVRTAEDIDDNALSYAEVKAIASGNPLIMKKAQVDSDVERLSRVRSAYSSQQINLKRTVAGIPERQRAIEKRLADARADEARLNLGKGDQFEATIAGKRYTKRVEAADALGKEVTRIQDLARETKLQQTKKIGALGGFEFSLRGDPNALREPDAIVHHSGGDATVPVSYAAPTGALTRLENHLGGIPGDREGIEAGLAKLLKEDKDARALIGKPFDREQEYQDAFARQKDIDEQLGLREKEQPNAQDITQDDEPSIQDQINANADAYHRGNMSYEDFDKEARRLQDLKVAGEGRVSRAQAFGKRGVKEAPRATRPMTFEDGTTLHLPDNPSPEEQRLISGVTAIAKRIVPDAKVIAARKIDVGEGFRQESGVRDSDGAGGITQIDGVRNLIAWSLESENAKVTLRHEAVHWLRANNYIKPDEWAAIEKASRENDWRGQFNIEARYPDAPEWLKTEESAAEAMGYGKTAPDWVPEPLRPIFEKVNQILSQVADYVRRAFGANVTAKDVFSRIESGEVGQRIPGAQGQIQAAQAAPRRLETEQDRINAQRKRMTTYQDVAKSKVLFDSVKNWKANDNLPLSKGIDALTRGINEPVKGARDSTAAQQVGRQNDFVGRFTSNLEKLPGGMAAWTGRTMTADWVRELAELNKVKGGKPGLTGNKMALKIAEAVHDAQDTARYHLNKSGAWVGDYDGYVSRTLHNAVAIDRAGFEAWRDFALEHLDQARTFGGIEQDEDLKDEDGINAKQERFLKNIYDALSTGVHISSGAGVASKAGAFPAGFNLARKVSAERVLHWKDADAWRQYQERFGDPVIERGVLNSLMRAGRDTALMERWTTNPQFAFDTLLRKLKAEHRSDHAAIAELQRNEPRLREEFAHLTGEAHTPLNDLKTKISGAVRGWQDMTKLSYVLFTHMSIGATKPFQLKYHGMGRWQAYTSVLRDLAQDKSPEGQAVLENLRANATGQVQNIISGYEPIDGVPGKIAQLRMLAMRMGGLPWMLARQKSGSEWELANFLGQQVGKGYDELKPQTRRALGIYNIGQPEWDALRNAPFHDKDGQGSLYLTPAAAARAPDSAIIPLADDRYANARNAADEQRIIADTRDKLGMKLAAYYSDSADRSTVTPGIPERAFFTQHVGRFGGPIVGQYKTWALAAVRQMWGQAIQGSSRAEGVKMLAELVAVGTAMGYAREAIGDLLKGKDPEFFNGDWKHDLPLVGRSMLAGGGLGIFGDYLLGQFSSYSQSGKDRALEFISNLAGPVVGDIGSAYGIGSDLAAAPFQKRPEKAFRDTGAEGLRFFLDHVPLINAFYIRTIANWLILDRLQNMASPGYLKRYQDGVKKRTGEQFWLPPTQYAGAEQGAQQ